MQKQSRIAWVTIALIVANFALWALLFIQGEQRASEIIGACSFAPERLTAAVNASNNARVSSEVGRAAVSMFIHEYDYGHVVFNMLFLALFGLAVEKRLGKAGFATLYGVTGMMTAAFYWTVVPDGKAMFGASAAVCGVLGAYIVLFLKERPWRSVVPIIVLALNVYCAANADKFPQAGFTFWAHTAGAAFGAIGAAILTLQLAPRRNPPTPQIA